MLSNKQLGKIKEHLEKAQNPLFLFDNDVDGLASFMIMRRAFDRGKGVAIKSSPDLNISYLRKINELNPDYIFILDQPLVSDEFFEEVNKLNLPIVWIDHHDLGIKAPDYVDYYNSATDEKGDIKPTTYICYKAVGKKEDEWIAFLGCVSDGFYPEFSSDVEKKYPDLTTSCKSAFECVYETKLGKIIRILSFGLKDRTTNVINMLRFLVSVKGPYDIFEENTKTKSFHTRFGQIEEKYRKLVDKAKEDIEGDLIYFQYGGDLSISAEIANELFYLYPKKVIVVAYISGSRANISMRGSQDIRKLTEKAIEGLEGATGGGHIHATGAQVLIEDLPKFKARIETLVSEMF